MPSECHAPLPLKVIFMFEQRVNTRDIFLNFLVNCCCVAMCVLQDVIEGAHKPYRECVRPMGFRIQSQILHLRLHLLQHLNILQSGRNR